jgi:L-asparaginase II
MNPVLVEVTRGARVESRHRGAAAVVDADGGLVFAVGDVDQPIHPRSAVKALQALPLVESGAADRLGLTDAEIALACSSHSGETAHVAAARSMLGKAGRDEASLECGAHWPYYEGAARALVVAGRRPTALHNNCSGKHAGFICLACDRDENPAGYVKPNHPVMREVTAALADTTSTRLDDATPGVDGCSIPTYAIPLRALAQAFARFGTGTGLGPARAAAARRIRGAVAANPFMVAGTDRFDTKLMSALGARVFAKGGAEGVHCVAVPELGLGIAVKCEDGAARAADVATSALIARFLGRSVPEALRRPVLRNWNGITVGTVRATEVLEDAGISRQGSSA